MAARSLRAYISCASAVVWKASARQTFPDPAASTDIQGKLVFYGRYLNGARANSQPDLDIPKSVLAAGGDGLDTSRPLSLRQALLLGCRSGKSEDETAFVVDNVVFSCLSPNSWRIRPPTAIARELHRLSQHRQRLAPPSDTTSSYNPTAGSRLMSSAPRSTIRKDEAMTAALRPPFQVLIVAWRRTLL